MDISLGKVSALFFFFNLLRFFSTCDVFTNIVIEKILNHLMQNRKRLIYSILLGRLFIQVSKFVICFADQVRRVRSKYFYF